MIPRKHIYVFEMSRKKHEDAVMEDFPKADYAGVLKESDEVIRLCFKEYRVEQVFLSFNGGKDCTVLLDIVLNILRKTFPTNETQEELKIYCIRTINPFSELDEFLYNVESHYNVKLIFIQGDLKSSLGQILNEDPNLRACLMGTRRTDPYCANLEFLQPTDADWPQVMRVSPLLNWSYHQIWSYIHDKQVPYCRLYYKGYTSIGSTLNTRPNPALAYTDANGSLTYKPAWHLIDGSLERAGRGTKPNLVSNGTNGPVECECNGEVLAKDGGDVNAV